MSVHDAEPDDIYVDAAGKLWRVIGVCGEPTVIMREIEDVSRDDGTVPNPARRISGGVSGLMWQGFKRILRPDKKPRLREEYRGRRLGERIPMSRSICSTLQAASCCACGRGHAKQFSSPDGCHDRGDDYLAAHIVWNIRIQ